MTELKTRKPTGRPSWPILILAGAEKAGKSYSAAQATASPLIGRSYWVTIGEDEPDEYGQLGDFDIVEHDGSYRGLLEALRTTAAQPVPAEGVPLLIVDSMTRLWDLITGHAQDVANKRKKKGPGEDAQITMDLWNAARDQWVHVMDAIRDFPGPVILTARLELVAVMSDSGQPTTAKDWKVQAHKSLPYDVGAVIQMPARGETWITGVRSVKLQLAERTRAPKDFTVDWFWRQLGLGEVETGPRDHNAPKVATAPPAAAPQAPSRSVTQSPGPGRATPSPAVQALEEGLIPKEVVAQEWADDIAQIGSVNALYTLHTDAANRGVLEHRLPDGRTVEDVFRARREVLVEPAPEPDPYESVPAELPY